MPFKLTTCKGPYKLPLLEIPDGPSIFERLSPGTIREADIYENFRWGKNGKMLFACPRGKTKSGKCTVGQRLLRIRHPKTKMEQLIRDCKSGKLSEKRVKDIERIVRDVNNQLGQPQASATWHPLIAPHMVAKTPMGRIGQFLFVSLATTLMFMLWFRLLKGEDKK